MGRLRSRRFGFDLQQLESRELPATLVNPTTVTYQDFDGDVVTVRITKPLFIDAAAANSVLSFSSGTVDGINTVGQQLTAVSLFALGTNANGIGLSVTAVRSATTGGDGLVNVGHVDAVDTSTKLDLSSVLIDGDLGRIEAGDADTATRALASLTVQSLGRFGTSTGSPDLATAISGGLGTLRVKSDIVGALVNVTGSANGKIGAAIVGGSLIAVGATSSTGSIQSSGDIGSVRIGGDLIGGTGPDSGAVKCDGAIKGGVVVGGSLFGSGGGQSGRVRANLDISFVRIDVDVRGGTGNNSGQVRSVSGKIGRVDIGGSLAGGTVLQSGSVIASRGLGLVNIRGNIIGGAGSRSGGVMIDGDGDILSAFVGGSIFSGTGTTLSGFITANGSLGQVKVIGSLVGSSTNQVAIVGRGKNGPIGSATQDVAIKSLFVGGRVEFANILAGFAFDLAPVNADAQIGTVRVGGDWLASSIAAGVVSGGNGFGNSGDVLITDAVQDPAIRARIGSIVIGGQAIGTAAAGDHFGFVAQEVVALSIGGAAIPLQAGPSNADIPIGVTGDLRVLEL